MAPMDAVAIPFPSELHTPPVTMMNRGLFRSFVFFCGTIGEKREGHVGVPVGFNFSVPAMDTTDFLRQEQGENNAYSDSLKVAF